MPLHVREPKTARAPPAPTAFAPTPPVTDFDASSSAAPTTTAPTTSTDSGTGPPFQAVRPTVMARSGSGMGDPATSFFTPAQHNQNIHNYSHRQNSQQPRPEIPPRPLRFAPPKLQIRPRQYDASAQRSPEPFTPGGFYASESDNESLWSVSNHSTTTTATSVHSDDDSKGPYEPKRRPSLKPALVRRQSVGTHLNSTNTVTAQTQSSNNRSHSQGRTFHIQIEPKGNRPVDIIIPAAPPKPQNLQAAPVKQQKQLPPAPSHDHTLDVRPPTRAPPPRPTVGQPTCLNAMQEIHSLKNQVNLLSEESSEAREQHEHARHKLVTLIQEKDTQRAEFQAKSKELRLQNDQLLQENEDLDLQLDKVERLAKEQRLAIRKAEANQNAVEELKQEHDANILFLRAELEQDHAATVEALRTELKQEHTAIVQALRVEHDQLDESAKLQHESALKEIQSKCELLTETQKTSEEKLEAMNEMLSQYKELKDHLTEKCEALEKELKSQTIKAEDYMARTTNLTRELEDHHAIKKAQDIAYVAQIATLEITVESLNLRVKGLEDDLLKNAGELGELTAQRDRLKLDVEEQSVTMDSIKKEQDSLKEQIASHQALVADKEKDIADKADLISNLEKEKEEITGRLEVVEKEKETFEKKAAETETKRKKLRKQADGLKEEVKTLTTQVETVVKEKEDLTSEVARITDECAQLRAAAEPKEEPAPEPAPEPAAEAAPEEKAAPEPEPAKVEDAPEPEQAKEAPIETPAEPPAPAPAPAIPEEIIAKLASLDETTAQVTSLHVSNAGLTAQLDDAKKDLGSAKKRVEKVKKELAAVQAKLDAEKEAHSAASSEAATLKAEAASLKVQLKALNKQLSSQSPDGRGRSTKTKTCKRPDELVVVRCPRDGSQGLTIVRRKNLHLVQRSASPPSVC